MALILLSVLFSYQLLGFGNGYSLNNTFLDTTYELKLVNDGPTPDEVDWRTKNMISPVKDQHSCNACWAFSAVANIESLIKIHYGYEVNLSEQFLINCDGGRAGCGQQGILETFARIVAKLGGVLREGDYMPYVGKLMPCNWHGVPKPVPVVGFRRVPANVADIKSYIYRYGPVSAGINSKSMEKYKGGLDEPTEEECPPNHLNHAVLIVGFGVQANKDTGRSVPYWIIKNSWGPKWGASGYYYLTMEGNACGITNDVSISIV